MEFFSGDPSRLLLADEAFLCQAASCSCKGVMSWGGRSWSVFLLVFGRSLHVFPYFSFTSLAHIVFMGVFAGRSPERFFFDLGGFMASFWTPLGCLSKISAVLFSCLAWVVPGGTPKSETNLLAPSIQNFLPAWNSNPEPFQIRR